LTPPVARLKASATLANLNTQKGIVLGK